MKKGLLILIFSFSLIQLSTGQDLKTEYVYQFIEGNNTDSTIVFERTLKNGLLIHEKMRGFKYCNRSGLGDNEKKLEYKDSILVKKTIESGYGPRKQTTIHTYKYDSLGRLSHEFIDSPTSTAIIGQTGFQIEIYFYYVGKSDTLREEKVFIPRKNQLIKVREHKHSKNSHVIIEHTKKPFYSRTEGESYLYKYQGGLLIKEEKRYWNGDLEYTILYYYNAKGGLSKEISNTPLGEKKVIRKYPKS